MPSPLLLVRQLTSVAHFDAVGRGHPPHQVLTLPRKIFGARIAEGQLALLTRHRRLALAERGDRDFGRHEEEPAYCAAIGAAASLDLRRDCGSGVRSPRLVPALQAATARAAQLAGTVCAGLCRL